MSIGIRHYIFPENDPPVRLSDRVVSGLVHGNDALPIFSDTKQRVMTAFLELNDGKPVRIYKTENTVWAFDDQGDITESIQKALGLVFGSIDVGVDVDNSKVVSIDRKLKKKRLVDEHRWDPTAEHLAIIARDIWPKTKADRLQIISGVSKRRPAMTWDAEQAFREATEGFFKISMAVSNLKEPSLKAFIFKARENAQAGTHEHLHRALADMAQQELDIIVRRKKNKGVWYASVDVIRWGADGTGQSVANIHKRCNSRTEAEEKGRALLSEHAQYFSADTTIEVSVVTDLEWLRDGGSVDAG